MMLPFPEPLWKKYQPRRVRDFIGLAEVKRKLQAFIENPYPYAWFFLGGSGLGKTSLAQAIAEEINAQLHEIPSAECDLDRVLRETDQCKYGAFNFFAKPGESPYREWHEIAVHEADKMTPAAQVGFLSKMDSTAWPPQTIYVFTANSRLNLDARFLSRCSVEEFHADSVEDELPGYLAKIYKLEGGKYPVDFARIAKITGYNVRDALNKLQGELLLGTNRKGLPSKDLKIIPEHFHECEKCHKPWKHAELKCKLPHTAVCPTCGGALNSRSAAAYKAHETMKRKAQEALLQELGQKQTRAEILAEPPIKLKTKKKGRTA